MVLHSQFTLLFKWHNTLFCSQYWPLVVYHHLVFTRLLFLFDYLALHYLFSIFTLSVSSYKFLFSLAQFFPHHFLTIVSISFTYFVLSSVFCIFLVILSIAACLLFSGSKSILFKMTTILLQAIWPMTRHSADCVCIPFVTSMTSIIRSIICAPAQEERQ